MIFLDSARKIMLLKACFCKRNLGAEAIDRNGEMAL
jgi:hypothetical protein